MNEWKRSGAHKFDRSGFGRLVGGGIVAMWGLSRISIAALMLVAASATSAIADPFDEAYLAYERGDFVEALAIWQPMASEGDADAQFNLGFMYDQGFGVDQDAATAFDWYRSAAEQGHVEAQHNVGLKFDQGTGIAQSYEQAFKWYALAAEQGHPGSQNNLGAFYDHGLGVERDAKLALHWYFAAARQGQPEAQNTIGILYYNGDGVPRDVVQALAWLKRAAAQGDVNAQKNSQLLADTLSAEDLAEAARVANEPLLE